MTRIRHLKIAIPDITKDPKTTNEAIKALKDNMENITGQKGASGSWFVTFDDLVALGIVTQVEVTSYLTNRG